MFEEIGIGPIIPIVLVFLAACVVGSVVWVKTRSHSTGDD